MILALMIMISNKYLLIMMLIIFTFRITLKRDITFKINMVRKKTHKENITLPAKNQKGGHHYKKVAKLWTFSVGGVLTPIP